MPPAKRKLQTTRAPRPQAEPGAKVPPVKKVIPVVRVPIVKKTVPVKKVADVITPPIKKVTPVKKTLVKKVAPTKKISPVTPIVKKTPVKKIPVKKTLARKTPAKKTPVKKVTPVATKKVPVKVAPVKKVTPVASKKVMVKATPIKKATPVSAKRPLKKPSVSPSVKIVAKRQSKSPKPITKVIIAKRIGDCVERSKMTLKTYQLRVINHLKKNRGLVVSHAAGSGKTLTAVVASQCYLDDHPTGKVVIVTPVSLQENMKKEMRGYGIDPDSTKWAPKYEFLTYAKFGTSYNTKTCRNMMLIVDEAHELRTTTPKGKRAMVAIKCAATADKVLLLTATSVYNKPSDTANLVAMVKGINPPTKREFEMIMDDPVLFKNFFSCIFSFYDTPTDENYPTFTEQWVEIEMTPKYYKDYHAVEEQNSHLFSDANPWAFLTGVRQASNSLEECMKCDWVLQKALTGQKMVIYSSFVSYGITAIQTLFDEHNIKYVEVSGNVKKLDRPKAVAAYNSNKVQIMFITKAGGQGLDLKGTRSVVIMESEWNAATDEQVMKRAIRYGSHTHLPKDQRHVDVYHLLIVKPPVGTSGRTDRDNRESADVIIREKMESKNEVSIEFLKRLYALSIEQTAC